MLRRQAPLLWLAIPTLSFLVRSGLMTRGLRGKKARRPTPDPVRSRPLPTFIPADFHIISKTFSGPVVFRFYAIFLRLIENFFSSILGLVLGVLLMYCRKKIGSTSSRYIRSIREDHRRVSMEGSPSGVSLPSPRPKSFTFTFFESSFQTAQLLASGVLRAPILSLPPCFRKAYKGDKWDGRLGRYGSYMSYRVTSLQQLTACSNLQRNWLSMGPAGKAGLGRGLSAER